MHVTGNSETVRYPTLRPTRARRAFHWCIATTGVLFGLSGLSVVNESGSDGGPVATVFMALTGAVFALCGFCPARSRVELRDDHLACRNAFRAHRIEREDIRSVEVVEGIWNYGGIPQDGLVVRTSSRHNDWASLRLNKPQFVLNPLQRFHSRRGVQVLANQRDMILEWVGEVPNDTG